MNEPQELNRDGTVKRGSLPLIRAVRWAKKMCDVTRLNNLMNVIQHANRLGGELLKLCLLVEVKRKEGGYRLGTNALNKIVMAVDVDGVLADQVPHVLARAEKEFGVRMHNTDVTKWDSMVGNIPFDKLIARYLKDPEWVKAMPVINGAKEGFAALEKCCEVIIATSIPEGAEGPRTEWLKKNFGFTGKLINTMKTGKAGIPADILIDDYPPNVDAFTSARPERHAILLKQSWNTQDATKYERDKGPVYVAENWTKIRDWALDTISSNIQRVAAHTR